MILESPSFPDGGILPPWCAHAAANRSPLLQWGNLPEGAQSLVLVCEDPDAPVGTFTHWLVYDIPADVGELPEGLPPDADPALAGRQGRNDFGEIGWGGPQPPPGEEHHYQFVLYAVDGWCQLPPAATKDQVIRALVGRVLGETRLVGRYGTISHQPTR